MPMLTNAEITANGLDVLEGDLGPANHVDRRFESLFGNEPGSSNKGDTYQIRKPPLYDVNEAWEANYQAIDDDSVPLVMDRPVSIDISIPDKDMHLDLTNFEYQVNKPAMSRLAHKWAQIVVGTYKKSWNYVGVPGVVTTGLSDYIQAGVILDENLAPRDGTRAIFLGPNAMGQTMAVLATLQNDQNKIGAQFRSGLIKRDTLGADWHMSQVMPIHTTGAVTGGGKIDGADQTGASLLTDDWTASSAVAKEGDIYDLTGYYDVNYITKDRVVGRSRRVVATADVTSDATGDETTLAIAPTLVAVGKLQNVTGTIADAENLLLFGHASSYASKTFQTGMMWPKAALALGMVELKTPDGMDTGATKTDEELRISMRFTRRWDQDKSKWFLRYQTFGGVALLRPEWMVRICG